VEKISAMAKEAACTKDKLAELIDTYDKLVFSICFKLTGDYFAAEDLAQETFLAAFYKYGSFDGHNEKAWICRIATNKSIDYLRSASRRNVPVEDSFFELTVEQRGSPEDICLEAEVRSQLERCCNELKAPYSQVAKDYYLAELSPKEIASKQGKSVKTIQTQLYRAREMLRRALKEICGKEEPA